LSFQNVKPLISEIKLVFLSKKNSFKDRCFIKIIISHFSSDLLAL